MKNLFKLNKKHSFPPGPKGKFITGSLKDFQASPLRFLSELSVVYGDISVFRLGPFQKIHLINNQDLIKEILVTKQSSFIKSPDIRSLKSLVGTGLLTSEKDYHLRQRRIIQPAFKKSHISSYAQDMITTTENYLAKWSDGEERLISEDMMNITLGIISKTMFSMDFEEGVSVIGEPMETIMKKAVKRMRSIVPIPLSIPTKDNRSYKRAVKSLDDVLYSIISKRRQDSTEHEDLLGILMSAKDDTNENMSDVQLRDELMTIFLAGHETTANAMMWTLYLLTQHPEAVTKLHKELDRVVGDAPVKPEQFSKLLYTQNIISESLRLYPPAYVIGRQADKDVKIGNCSLKKGDTVLISQYVMQRNPEFFNEPDSFKPERFENNFVKTLPEYTYFPFGGGPRVCIGNHFAFMETVLVLASITRNYKVSLAQNHHTIKPQPLITLRPKHGIFMKVDKRKD